MPLNLPEGKRIAVNIGVHFDAHAVWIGTFGQTTPGVLSRGEFGAEVGVPRLLDLFRRYDVASTFFTPTHSMATFPAATRAIADAGHEFAAHGCWHEKIPDLDEESERAMMRRVLDDFDRYIGNRPRGYGSPAWDFSDHTMSILEELGFEWDSSLMGRDFHPYRPRPVTVDRENGDTFGPPSTILELPISWHLDDFPALEFIPGFVEGLGPTEVVFQRWKDHFDYAYRNEPSAMIAYTVHPQCIGRAHAISMFERLVEYMAGYSDTWFATCSEIYEAWTD